jgi:hypothetical protein
VFDFRKKGGCVDPKPPFDGGTRKMSEQMDLLVEALGHSGCFDTFALLVPYGRLILSIRRVYNAQAAHQIASIGCPFPPAIREILVLIFFSQYLNTILLRTWQFHHIQAPE